MSNNQSIVTTSPTMNPARRRQRGSGLVGNIDLGRFAPYPPARPAVTNTQSSTTNAQSSTSETATTKEAKKATPATSLITQSTPVPNCKFPLQSTSHGLELVTIDVGDGANSRRFLIHKSLLCEASSYFSAAFSGKFEEAKEKTLTLQQHSPVAFEVMYQYIYTGHIQASKFYIGSGKAVGVDLLWLRTFKLADATMVSDLARAAYERLREYFNAVSGAVPSQIFTDELFDSDFPQVGLQKYIAAHSACCINQSKKFTPWSKLMEKNVLYSAAVGLQLAKIQADDYTGSKLHPLLQAAFNYDALFGSSPSLQNSTASNNVTSAEIGSDAKVSERLHDQIGHNVAS